MTLVDTRFPLCRVLVWTYWYIEYWIIVIQGDSYYIVRARKQKVSRPRFELRTFCVLDRCDNQLRHRPIKTIITWALSVGSQRIEDFKVVSIWFANLNVEGLGVWRSLVGTVTRMFIPFDRNASHPVEPQQFPKLDRRRPPTSRSCGSDVASDVYQLHSFNLCLVCVPNYVILCLLFPSTYLNLYVGLLARFVKYRLGILHETLPAPSTTYSRRICTVVCYTETAISFSITIPTSAVHSSLVIDSEIFRSQGQVWCLTLRLLHPSLST
jgi:hypothetical protein